MADLLHGGEWMPCPVCGRASEYHYEGVACECGVRLAILVPLFAATAQPYGWRWAVVCTSCGQKMTDQEAAYCAVMKMDQACTSCIGADKEG